MNRNTALLRSISIVSCLFVLLPTGCVTTRFALQKEFVNPIQAVVLSNPLAVHRSHTNAVEITGPARLALRAERVTQGIISMEVIRSDASPLTLNMRTTPYEDSVLHRSGIRIIIHGDSTTVESSDFHTVLSTPLPIGIPFLVEIRNLGHAFHLRLGHNDFGPFRSLLPCTEWIIISTAGSGRVLIGDPWFDTTI